MRLEQLAYFSAVAECGSISAAALRLGVSQPAVSAAVKALEQEAGGQLLRRGSRGAVLTSLGYMTCEDARRMLGIAQDIRERGRDASMKGMVSVCAQPQLSSHLTRTILVPFHRVNPNIDVFVHNAALFELEEQLGSGRCSMAVMLTMEGNELHAVADRLGGHAVHLYTDVRRLFLGGGHPLARKERLEKDDLATLDLAYYSRHSDMISSKYRDYFRREYRLAEREDILDLVMSGEAACIQCGALLKNDYRVRRGMLVEKALPDGLAMNPSAPVVAVCSGNLMPAEQEFWNVLTGHFADGLESFRAAPADQPALPA